MHPCSSNGDGARLPPLAAPPPAAAGLRTSAPTAHAASCRRTARCRPPSRPAASWTRSSPRFAPTVSTCEPVVGACRCGAAECESALPRAAPCARRGTYASSYEWSVTVRAPPHRELPVSACAHRPHSRLGPPHIAGRLLVHGWLRHPAVVPALRWLDVIRRLCALWRLEDPRHEAVLLRHRRRHHRRHRHCNQRHACSLASCLPTQLAPAPSAAWASTATGWLRDGGPALAGIALPRSRPASLARRYP